MWYRPPSFAAESLEPRRLFAAAPPTVLDQYMVELINRARAKPAAEAARLGVALNEGLAPGTISTAPKQPLAINPYVTDAARTHSQWQIDADVFSHTGSGGSSPGDRIAAAGYAFHSPSAWGENVAWRSSGGSALSAPLVEQLHAGLFVDAGVSGRGHRTNLMSDGFREIGPGLTLGILNDIRVGLITTDFATTAGNPFLTGVAYDDTVIPDGFYTPDEGLGGVTVTAKRLSDNAVFSTTTFSTGGYALALPAGTYGVTASGGGLAQGITFTTVTIGSENVKTDFVPGTAPAGDVAPPTAQLTRALRQRSATRYYPFAVTYTDDQAVDPATFDNYDIVVTGPGGYLRYANFNSTATTTLGSPRTVDYVVKGPGGSWDAADNGVYTITLRRRQVRDVTGNPAAATQLGAFSVIIPKAASVPRASIASAPGPRPFARHRADEDAPVFA